MLASRHTYTWIQKYIFPGGLIPSVTAIEESLHRRTRLRVTERHDFGAHYAQTLQHLAGPVPRPRSTRSARSASTRSSSACGSSTCATPRPGSAPGTWTSASSPWSGRDRRGRARPGTAGTTGRQRTPGTTKAPSAAATIAWAASQAGVILPVRVRAWDGSECGPASAPAIVLRSPRALRRILWRPGELGLARAYISGDLDVDGDLTEGLRRARRAFGPGRVRWGPARWAAAASAAALAAGRLGSSARRHRRRPARPGTADARTAGPGTRP